VRKRVTAQESQESVELQIPAVSGQPALGSEDKYPGPAKAVRPQGSSGHQQG